MSASLIADLRSSPPAINSSANFVASACPSLSVPRDDPANRERELALRTDFHRHLIVRRGQRALKLLRASLGILERLSERFIGSSLVISFTLSSAGIHELLAVDFLPSFIT